MMENTGPSSSGEKGGVECGDGDSLAVSVTKSLSVGPESEMCQQDVGEAKNTPDNKALELFEKSLNKRQNVYSPDPVPLNSPWTFWVDRTERGVNVQQYEANLKKIYTAYTVRRFWGVYHNIPKPSELNVRSSLHMMRDERKPVWEESYNCKGGCFRLRIQKKDTNKVWSQMLLAAIGEQFKEYVAKGDEVCGVSVSIRDMGDVISVWNKNAEVANQAKIFECVRLILPDTKFLSTYYKPHETHDEFESPRGIETKGINNSAAAAGAKS